MSSDSSCPPRGKVKSREHNVSSAKPSIAHITTGGAITELVVHLADGRWLVLET